MVIIHKKSSGKKTSSVLIHSGPCYYFGFTCKPGGFDQTIVCYDALSAIGIEVEDFDIDGTKKTDGHSHSKPVLCDTGLYLNLTGGSVVVYYAPIPNIYFIPYQVERNG